MIGDSRFTFDESVTVIGTGSLGRTLAKALYEQEVKIYSLFNRSPQPLNELREIVKPGHTGSFPESMNQLGDIIFITTSDTAIQKVSNRLADLSNTFSNHTFIHCSGTKPSAVLSPLAKKGAHTAAFHPVQTFTAQSKPNDFNGIYFDLEGDAKAISLLKKIAEQLGAHHFAISSKAKPYLHAAGVTASNYFLAILQASAAIAEMGGIKKEKAIEALLPLAFKTVENAMEADHLSDALSGPIARGDDETVAGHLELLKENPKLYRLYQELGEETLTLARQQERLSVDKQRLMTNLFQKTDDR